jgi:glycosyltransferase involved in cell wall biosynthesis
MAESPQELYIHVPYPGDHYSFATGSAVPTVIYELSRRHAAHGGRTQVIVGAGTRHDYPVGECVEVRFPGSLRKKQKAIDAGLGLLGFPRWMESAVYRPASDAIPPTHTGPICVHNSAGALPLFKAAHRNALVCLYAHNELFGTYSQPETRRLVASLDRVLCCSRYIANELEHRLGCASDKIRVVPNGVDIERFRPAPQPPDSEVPIILFVGRMIPTKGADLLLQAARKIYSPKRRFKVRLVGSRGFDANEPLTEYETLLRQIAEPMGDAVEFQPFVDRNRVVQEYQAASIFCAPANWNEPFGLVIAEALACGLPTVVSRRGGIMECSGDAALYFDPPDTDTLADHLACLVDDPQARAKWGALARARAETLSWEAQYLKLRAALSE